MKSMVVTLTEPDVTRMCRELLEATPTLIRKLDGGAYNDTYAVSFAARPDAILRVAPADCDQFASEQLLLRNGHAAEGRVQALSVATPAAIMVDFSRMRWDRDIVFYEVMPGSPAPKVLPRYERSLWTNYYRGLAELAKELHGIEGVAF